MLLKHFTGSASAVVDAAPDEVLRALIEVDRLPQWNERIAKVLEPASGPMGEGVEWVVRMHVGPATWPSRATCTAYDVEQGIFTHRSVSDDGNPSYALWDWRVAPVAGGSQVDVTWQANPETFWRQALFAKLRRKQLVGEVEASLRALSYQLAATRVG